MVRIHPDPPTDSRGPPRKILKHDHGGAIAQLGERLLCKQEVTGSIPVGSTSDIARSRGSSNRRRTRDDDWCFFETLRLLFNNL